MNEIRDALPSTDYQPVTGLCIVADPANCPPGYSLIDKTYDRREDADLWKDRFFGRRITRYMCMETSTVDAEKDVLVDMTIINDRDPVPVGYQCLEFTKDTGETAQKKKQLCLRWMNSSLTQDAICEVMLMSRSRRPPVGFTLAGELNALQLCFKMATIPKPPAISQVNNVPPYLPKPTPYTVNTNLNGPTATQLPYSVAPHNSVQTSTTLQKSPTGERNPANPLAGIPWQLNPKLMAGTGFKTNGVCEIPYKSFSDIENQYSYKFNLEHSAAARMPPELS